MHTYVSGNAKATVLQLMHVRTYNNCIATTVKYITLPNSLLFTALPIYIAKGRYVGR